VVVRERSWRRRASRVAASVFAVWPALAAAQSVDPCKGFEARLATPTDVTLDDLAHSSDYKGRAVRTKGTVDFEVDPATSRRGKFVLRQGLTRVPVVPCYQIERDFEDAASKRPELQVHGLFMDLPGAPASSGTPGLGILIWSYVDAAELERPRRQAAGGGLAQLLESPDPPLDKTLRLTGQFGGKNLLKDLPPESAPEASAWVLRDGRQAIWVVGKKPEGIGFKLDPEYPADAGKWIAVEGKLERCGALLCLRARRVSLSGPPS
jgi:hypothetical protein